MSPSPCAAPSSDPSVTPLVWYWGNQLEGEHLAKALPELERKVLLERLLILDVAFKQHDGLTDIVANMLAPWGARVLRADFYVRVLLQMEPCPSWAVAGAANRVRAGELGNPDFAPTPGRLRAVAWGIAAPLWTEMRRIKLIVKAKAPREQEPAEVRKRVADNVRAWLEQYKANGALSEIKNPRMIPAHLNGHVQAFCNPSAGPNPQSSQIASTSCEDDAFPDF